MTISLERTYRFSAAHRYFRPDWSEEENRRRFGSCALPHGHGHNYRLTLTVNGTVDPETGFVVDLLELDRLVQEHVLAVVDHQHLNHVIERFAPGGLVPTSENVLAWIVEAIRGALPEGTALGRARLAEDDDLAAIWSNGGDPSP